MTSGKISLLALIGIMAINVVSCSPEQAKDAKKQEKVISVQIEKPTSALQTGITASGQIEASQTATISTRIMGYITGVRVKAGDQVKKGQLLVTISGEDILAKQAQTEAVVLQAEASFKSAEKDYQRFKDLFEQKSASAKELDNITLQYETAKAQVKAAQQMRAEANSMLAYTNITAPFSGTVTQKMVDPGSMANPGMPLLVIEHHGDFQVSATIPETEITRISTGAEAIVTVKSINRSFSGIITQLSPSSVSTGGQYALKINVPAKEKSGLRAGMYVNVLIPRNDIDISKSDAVIIPSEAIVTRGQLTGIFTPGISNTAILRWVRLGKKFGNNVEVLSGLGQNEQYILRADSKLYNGASIKATTNQLTYTAE